MSETEKDHAFGMSDSAKNDLSESAHQYEVGDIIVYQTFSGDYRRVKVTSKESNIKNGRPGFDAHIAGDSKYAVWGYDAQIVQVLSEST